MVWPYLQDIIQTDSEMNLRETILPNQFLSYPSPNTFANTQHTPKKPRPEGRGFLALLPHCICGEIKV